MRDVLLYVIRRATKGTKATAATKKSHSRDKDQKRKTDMHNKEHKVTKIIYTKQQKQTSNSDSTKTLEHGQGAPVG